jgi:hypothetical protein
MTRQALVARPSRHALVYFYPAQRALDYRRAMAACLEGRGYEIR